MNKKHRLTIAAVVLSVILFGFKLWAGAVSGSIAVISDALNSFLDIASYSIIALSARVQDQRPDRDHPFGHRRAEPLAGFLIAVFASLLGATIVKDAVTDLLQTSPGTRALGPTVVLLVSIAAKVVLVSAYRREWRRTGSPALKASMVDSRNDILASALALMGFWIGGWWDNVAALLIGGWIFYAGLRIGLENTGYLMGRAPDAAVVESMRAAAAEVPGVTSCHTVRAHYVGDQVQVEVHVEVPADLSLRQAHDLGVAVQARLETMPEVLHAFVHIDPEGLQEDPRREDYLPWRQRGGGSVPSHQKSD